jgi:hypothetical protein
MDGRSKDLSREMQTYTSLEKSGRKIKEKEMRR